MDNQRIVDSNVTIATAVEEDWEEAMEVAWKTFLKFEAPEYGKEGTDHFLEFISGEELFKMFLAGEYHVAVAKADGKIVGVVSLRMGNHISLLFVDEKYHHMKIATRLLKYAQDEFLIPPEIRLSVNAAPYAIDFYKKVGFVESMELQKTDGITYLPMMLFSKVNA